MNEKQREADESASEPARKRYEPPRIEESGQFEHMVLQCGREMGGSGMCAVSQRSVS